ncbi:MAG: T9SS type A sorting domain-containing protein [Bacteroidetes bacterium]|nr:T9SS type A sorting domain-containing protein [Bacteroidota bacterium]
MIVYNGELYVSGHFLTIYGDPGDLIAKWDGTSWSSVGSGLSGGNCLDMQVFNSELYVGGSLIAAGGLPVNNIAKWDGTNWYNIGANFNNWVICMEAMDSNNLFLGGGFTMINNDTVKNICKYNILTSVNELQNESNFSIYPNPANDKITVTVSENIEYVFELRDIYNRICIQKENIKELDVSTLTNGIYSVRILVSNKIQYSGKLVIIK